MPLNTGHSKHEMSPALYTEQGIMEHSHGCVQKGCNIYWSLQPPSLLWELPAGDYCHWILGTANTGMSSTLHTEQGDYQAYPWLCSERMEPPSIYASFAQIQQWISIFTWFSLCYNFHIFLTDKHAEVEISSVSGVLPKVFMTPIQASILRIFGHVTHNFNMFF